MKFNLMRTIYSKFDCQIRKNIILVNFYHSFEAKHKIKAKKVVLYSQLESLKSKLQF